MNAPDPSGHSNDDVYVPGEVRDLLFALLDGRKPEPFAPDVASASYGKTNVSDLSPAVKVDGDRLTLTFAGQLNLSSDTQPESFTGLLSSGLPFEGSPITSYTSSTKVRKDAWSSEAEVRASCWGVGEREGIRFWIGRVAGAQNIQRGNLVIERYEDDLRLHSPHHFRFQGSYTYYIVQRGKGARRTWDLLIDTGEATLSDQALGTDFLALEFVFGTHLHVATFTGVTADFESRAWLSGIGDIPLPSSKAAYPIPTDRSNDSYVDEIWSSVLFERISETVRKQAGMKRALDIALSRYVMARTMNLDLDYEILQVALEAASYQLGKENPTALVRNVEAWRTWIQEVEPIIRSHAAEGREDQLRGKFDHVHKLGSGRGVVEAFDAHSLVVLPWMKKELSGRNDVVHQGLMSPKGYEFPRDIERVDRVRTMLIALVSKVVGYQGAIRGWATGEAGYPIEPDASFWPVAEAERERASKTFIAEKPKVENEEIITVGMNPGYERVTADCPLCDRTSTFNRVSDLNSKEPIDQAFVRCEHDDCAKRFAISGDAVSPGHALMLRDSHEFLLQKRYIQCVLSACTAVEWFLAHFLSVQLVLSPARRLALSDDQLRSLATSLSKRIAHWTFDRLRNAVLHLLLRGESEPISEGKARDRCQSRIGSFEDATEAIKHLCGDAPANAAFTPSVPVLFHQLRDLNVNKTRNNVVHKAAYLPSREEASVVYTQVSQLLSGLEREFGIGPAWVHLNR